MHEKNTSATTPLSAVGGTQLSRRRALGLGGLGAAAAVGLTGLAASSAGAATPDRKVLFRDDFLGSAGATPDATKWTVTTGTTEESSRNEELQTYTADASNVSLNGSGNLALTGRHDGDAWTSGRIDTSSTFAFRYGEVEARMKLPASTGSAPVFGLLPKNGPAWPLGGEIDVMVREGAEDKAGTIYGALQADKLSGSGLVGQDYSLPSGQSFADGYHRFKVRKEPNLIRFYVDGNEYFTMSPDTMPGAWPYEDYDYYLFLEQAIGGFNGGNGSAEAGQWPQTTLVDWVWVVSL